MLCQFLLYNEVNQPHEYTYTSLFRCPTPPHPSKSYSMFALVICFMYGSTHMSLPVSQLVPSQLCPPVHPLRLFLYCCCLVAQS